MRVRSHQRRTRDRRRYLQVGARRAVTRTLLLLTVLALLATACGGAEDTADDTAEAPAGGASEGAAVEDEPVELNVWFAREYFVPPEEHVQRFQDEHPNITVNTDVQPDDDLFQQLIRMSDADQELPDAVQLDGFLRPAVAEAGVVVPIQDVVDAWAEEDPESYEQIYDGVWEEGMYDGELVGMANTASMEEVYFRSDWLGEAGVEAPQTWDEVLDAARAIKQVQPDVVPFGWWATRGGGANAVFASMTAMGVEFDGSIPDLTSEAGQYWIDFIQTLSREELVHPEAIAWSDDEMRGGFVGGNVGMMLDSAPTSGDAQDAGLEPGEHFELVPMPTSRSGGGQDGTLTAPARTWHITTSGEEHKEAAGLFLRFLMEPEVALDVMELGGDPHRTASVLEDQDALSQVLPIWDEDNVAAFGGTGVFPVDINSAASEDLMEQLNQHVVDNPDEDPAAVAEQWQAQFDGLGE